MYVVEVAPLSRGFPRAALSYFSRDLYARGTILSIPLRTRSVQGLVLSCEEVSATKAALRRATFSLRKLPEQPAASILPEALLAAARELAEYYAASFGSVLFSLLPKEVRSGALELPAVDLETHDSEPSQRTHKHLVLSAPRTERLDHYETLVRDAFARDESVALIAPTLEEVRQLSSHFTPRFPKRTVSLSGGRGIRALRAAHATLQKPGARLIIASPQYALLAPRVGTIILERSRARSYRTRERPWLDMRHALLTYAARAECRVLSTDTLLRSEDAHRLTTGAATPLRDRVPRRLTLPGKLSVVSRKEKPSTEESFALLSPKLLGVLEEAGEGHSFLFAARRGLAPVVACLDCGAILRCPESGAPLSLHRKLEDGVETRWLVSNVSGFSRRADDLCEVCGSWRLRERGIGVQHVYDELLTHVPRERLFLLDYESASTPKRAAAIRDRFYATRGSVLLGTALALPYLTEPLALSAVTSLDALRATPSWRQEEESLGTLLTLREVTEGPVIVQTRDADADSLLGHAKRGSVEDFYTEELSARETFRYPPFRTFVHLAWHKESVDGSTDTLGTLVEETLAPFTPSLYSAPDAEDRIGYALLRLSPEHWPDDALVDALRSLPPSVRITIDPDQIV